MEQQLQPGASCAALSVSPAGTSDAWRASLNNCADDDNDDGGHTQRLPDSVWSEFTETFRVIELAVSEGLRSSIDAPPPTTFQPELEMSAAAAEVPPAERDNRHQYALQLTRRDVSARRQCEYDVTCAAVARRRDGDDVRYAVSYNRWITVARQPSAGARQTLATYDASDKQMMNVASGDSDSDYKPKGECLWGASETADSWLPAWPAVKQEQLEERPSCAYQFWRDDSDPRQQQQQQQFARAARFRCPRPSEFNDCRYAAHSCNKVCKNFFIILTSLFYISI